ncbi:MAG: hypothetical protein HLUCCA11_02605 [Phormidesmis priestleyi Ana]|uniref:Uncharacterized protein n=1 Tax=Phormidesmis priestleyi Ana TaxID=1666911 RepID=A0A0P8A2Y2_9CYAN|nr:MAG: hypothetical protein HLUCCA11_02605 [Phormidesmis priestleyi Ana]
MFKKALLPSSADRNFRTESIGAEDVKTNVGAE